MSTKQNGDVAGRPAVPGGGPADEATKRRRGISLLALVLANLVPLYGVVFHGWSIFFVMLVYWMENVVVGFYNVLRMLFACGTGLPVGEEEGGKNAKAAPAAATGAQPMPPNGLLTATQLFTHGVKLFIIPFFIFHYGMFTLIHGVFVVTLFGKGITGGPAFSGGPFSIVGESLAGAPDQLSIFWAFAALMISHGISFGLNYMKDGEYLRVSAPELMGRPYPRIVVLHLTIIFGGFGVMALGGAMPALVLLTVLKIAVDVGLINMEGKFKPKRIKLRHKLGG